MTLVGACTLVGLLAGCGGEEPCTIGGAEGCADGLVCESFAGGDPQCTQPVFVEGRVFDALDDGAIEDARVIARDANGGARSDVTFSIADGTYSLRVSVPRDADGRPLEEQITLRVDAAGYEPFPKAPREALPLDLTSAVDADGQWTVMNAATDVALLPRSDASGSTIEGVVDHPDPGGVLVVAEQGGVAVATSITGSSGSFTLYDVPTGSTTLLGYRVGLYAGPATVDAVAAGVTGVVLSATSDGLASVSGSVNIVNAPGGLTTSVILVVASTFEEATLRGETPAGLRAAPVSGGFTIPDVPTGRYAVLAAFENDRLVRDPDSGISGTAIVFIDVGASDVDIATSFKVTEALGVVSPGADGLELVTTVPDLVFEQDSSEDGYELRLYDAFGNLVHEDTTLGPGSGSAPITYALDGRVELIPGMIYQFRAWSVARGSYISSTEDLLGVFQYEP
jgi:hypothetical protein